MNAFGTAPGESATAAPVTRRLDMEALMCAVRWPGADRQAVVTLAGLLMAARRYGEGAGYFLERAADEPDRPLYAALAGFFEIKAGRELGPALARLDGAAERELGLPHYLRALALVDLPGFAGRAETVLADLEFVVAVKDQFPVGFLRAARLGLARAYQAVGRAAEAEDALELSGYAGLAHDVPVLTADASVTARDGARLASPRLTQPVPGVHLAQGFDFSDFAFVETGAGIVAIDTGSSTRHAQAALAELRKTVTAPVTHVIFTHAHWDHTGGLAAVSGDGAEVIAQGNFAGELAVQRSVPVISPYFLPEGGSQRQQISPHRLVTGPERLRAGDVEIGLYPIHGGETTDGLVIHLPDRGLVFTGDMIMPYLGAPFLPEGSAEGLLGAMHKVRELNPRLLIHGHPPLTQLFTIETFPALETALRGLHEAVVAAIAQGATLAGLLAQNHLPGHLRDHPAAVVPYLVIRDNLIQRVHHQRTGYWKSGGDGVEHFAPAEWAAALDLLGGGREEAFVAAGERLYGSGDDALALKIADYGLLNYPGSGPLTMLRRAVLLRLIERNQYLNPFKFIYYAGLAGLELPPAQ